MRTILKYSLTAFLLLLSCAVALAQTDRKEVRAGNRQFKKGNWQNAEIEYRKAQVKDSSSFAANYNLAGALYREGNFDEAGKSLGRLKDVAPVSANSADYYYNLGNIAVQKRTGRPLWMPTNSPCFVILETWTPRRTMPTPSRC